MYRKILVPFMLVNNSVYTFISGILVSLSVNIFTSLCFEKSSFCSSWYMYVASLAFLFSSASCMFVSAKLTRFQNYIIEKRITDFEMKKNIVLDATKGSRVNWTITYICTVLFFSSGIIFLVFNFIVKS